MTLAAAGWRMHLVCIAEKTDGELGYSDGNIRGPDGEEFSEPYGDSTLASSASAPWTQGRRSKKNSGELKGSEGETRIHVEDGILLGGKSSQKL